MSNINVGAVIKETAEYKIVVWEGTDAQQTGEYAVVNKEHGVHETSTPLLPQAFEYLEQIQAAYDKYMKDDEPESATVHSINGEDKVH